MRGEVLVPELTICAEEPHPHEERTPVVDEDRYCLAWTQLTAEDVAVPSADVTQVLEKQPDDVVRNYRNEERHCAAENPRCLPCSD